VIRKCVTPVPDKLCVIFELPASLWADQVCVVGDFNQWDPTKTLMRQTRNGIWQAKVELPIGRCFAFRYLIDGRWSTDPHADGVVPGDRGSHNSLLITDPIIRRPDPALGQGMVHERPAISPGYGVEQAVPPQEPQMVPETGQHETVVRFSSKL
jgi:hypothetical protein